MNSVLDTVLAVLFFLRYKIPMTSKADLRQQALLHREQIRPEDEDIENAAKLFREQVSIKQGQVVAGYWPMGNEFDVRYLMQDAQQAGAKLALPVATRTSRVMGFAPWDGKSELVKGSWGVMVPDTMVRSEPDIVLVPFLAFDRRGYRLGRGGGHYDATIADLRTKKDVLVIGVGYAAQAVLFNLPIEDHDEKMDMIITPSGVHDFRN